MREEKECEERKRELRRGAIRKIKYRESREECE